MQTMPDTVITMLAFGMPSMWELLVILLIGLLIFGRRLPEVGRNIGKSIVEFKKGVKGIEDDVDHASTSKAATQLPDESVGRGDSASVEEAMGKVMPDGDKQGNG